MKNNTFLPLLTCIANIIDKFKRVDKIDFDVKTVEVDETDTRISKETWIIPYKRTDILINNRILSEILREHEKEEAHKKSASVSIAGLYDGIDPQDLYKNLCKSNTETFILQCSECYSSNCGSHLHCKVKWGLFFVTMYDFHQEPYTGNNCVHVETKERAFFDYSTLKPFVFNKWQFNKALEKLKSF